MRAVLATPKLCPAQVGEMVLQPALTRRAALLGVAALPLVTAPSIDEQAAAWDRMMAVVGSSEDVPRRTVTVDRAARQFWDADTQRRLIRAEAKALVHGEFLEVRYVE